MTADPTPAEFYDELADEYHLIFADWDASIARQARVMTGLLRDLGLTSGAVLDASCGIRTQAIGLARAGFSVTATDISRASVERCAREASARGLTMATGVADLRVLDVDGAGNFDAAVSFDNALPHLLDDADLTPRLPHCDAFCVPTGCCWSPSATTTRCCASDPPATCLASMPPKTASASSSRFGTGCPTRGRCRRRPASTSPSSPLAPQGEAVTGS